MGRLEQQLSLKATQDNRSVIDKLMDNMSKIITLIYSAALPMASIWRFNI